MLLSSRLSQLPHVSHGFFGIDYDVGQYTLNESKNSIRLKNLMKGARFILQDQVHTSIVNMVTQDTQSRVIGDALITQCSRVILCVRSADCAPIVLAHKTKPVISAIHAGWKGVVLQHILEKTADQLSQIDDLKHYVVAIGPCLHQESFQTGAIIYNNVFNKTYFDCKRYFDFPRFIEDKLKNLGFYDVDVIPVNTYQNPYYASFRRSQGLEKKARNASLIMLRSQRGDG